MHRLLIVEDEVVQRLVLARHFRGLNCHVVCASDAVEALLALLTQRFDLILADIGMPYLDGIEFLHALRGDVRTSNIPLVFLTGQSDTLTRQRAICAGANAFLAKPCPIARIADTVARVLNETGTMLI
jgi:CheY-like chemotaxis protein